MKAAPAPERLYSQDMLLEIVNRSAIVRALEKGDRSHDEIAAEFGVSRRTVGRILVRNKQGAPLFDRRHDNPGRKTAVADEAIGFALQYLEFFPKANLTDVHAAMARGEYDYKGQVPTYRQLGYTLGKLPSDMVDIIRNGTKKYIQESALTPRREEPHVNSQWQIDATELPVHVIDIETGTLIKPWLIAAIDSYSRVIPMAVVCRSHPTSRDVLQGMLYAVLPGGQNFAYGVPSILVPDNHSIFRSEEFLDAMQRAGIAVEFPPNDAPQAKGKIERWFLRVAEQFCANLPGHADQSNGLAKAKRAAIPFPCMQDLLDRYLSRYHATKHQTTNEAPWLRWQEGLTNAEGLVVDAKNIRDAFKLRKTAKVNRDGIFITDEGWHLHSPDLEGLQGEEIVLRVPLDGTKTGAEVYYRNVLVTRVTVVEGNTALADAINKGRVRRTDELKDFRKMMRARAAKVPTFSSAAQKPPRQKKVEVTVTTETSAAPREEKLARKKAGRKKAVRSAVPRLEAEPADSD